ncbi:MAG: DUF4386 domain-containing protein [Betaproteobacteria bacterium]|nr:DUF4386 domain-containing protein [Betaproteobacteria bacterium]
MSQAAVDPTQRLAAKVVGLCYLLAMVTAVFGFSVRGKLVVADSALETARNIMASEQLFRLGTASDLLTFIIDIVLITSIYVVLRPVNRYLALVALLWRVIETALLAVVTLNCLDVLRYLGSAEYLRVFEVERLHALARFSIAAIGGGYYFGFVFLGLGSALFSYLWWRSGYVPKSLAMLGIFASLLLAACNFAFIIDPALAKVVAPYYMAPMGLFEVAMGFWLLFAELRSPPDSRAAV